jgi:hypothetical protein
MIVNESCYLRGLYDLWAHGGGDVRLITNPILSPYIIFGNLWDQFKSPWSWVRRCFVLFRQSAIMSYSLLALRLMGLGEISS